MAEATLDQVKDEMFKVVKDTMGMKKWKPTDLHKHCFEKFGEDAYSKKIGKSAIKDLVNDGKLVYTYFGGSFLEIPHEEGAANK